MAKTYLINKMDFRDSSQAIRKSLGTTRDKHYIEVLKKSDVKKEIEKLNRKNYELYLEHFKQRCIDNEMFLIRIEKSLFGNFNIQKKVWQDFKTKLLSSEKKVISTSQPKSEYGGSTPNNTGSEPSEKHKRHKRIVKDDKGTILHRQNVHSKSR
jgi:hypothetical protein